MTVSRELSKYKLDLVGVQEVRWECSSTKLQENTYYSTQRGMRIMSAVKKVEFVSDRMSYIILRGRCCHVIVLNVHAPTVDKTDDVKDSLCEQLEHVFDKFPKYHMKTLLGDFNANVGRKDFLNRQLGMKFCTKLEMIMEL
jgi:hypothetical protein